MALLKIVFGCIAIAIGVCAAYLLIGLVLAFGDPDWVRVGSFLILLLSIVFLGIHTIRQGLKQLKHSS